MIASSQERTSTSSTSQGRKALVAKQKTPRLETKTMEKTREVAIPKKQPQIVKETIVNQATKYLKSVWGEAKRVTWPSKIEIQKGTIVVIAAVALISFYLFIVDRGIGFIFSFIRGLLHR